MVRILSLLFTLLFTLSAHAAQPGNVPAIGLDHNGATPGASSYLTIYDLSTTTNGPFHLVGGDINASLSVSNFYPLLFGGAPYKVSAGKTAYCCNIFCGYGANDAQLVSDTVAINYNSSSLTSGVYMSGQAGKYPLNCPATANFQPGCFPVGAGRYVGFQSGASAVTHMSVDCFER